MLGGFEIGDIGGWRGREPSPSGFNASCINGQEASGRARERAVRDLGGQTRGERFSQEGVSARVKTKTTHERRRDGDTERYVES